jgi:hypothetical protein
MKQIHPANFTNPDPSALPVVYVPGAIKLDVVQFLEAEPSRLPGENVSTQSGTFLA